jgi:hypothetical protein
MPAILAALDHSPAIAYAMALSRRTGLLVKPFKCVWFDECDYFKFFPLASIYPQA